MKKPSNRDVAAIFDEMAELLAIRGGDARRVWAFRRVARIVEHLGEPVDQMLAWGTLQKRRGIGEGAVRRIKQILRTGTCDDYDELRSELAGVGELLKVKGIGSSTVRFLHQRFRISTVDELESLARSGALLRLPRFGPDKTQEILHEIEIYRRRSEKVPLAEALADAEPIAEIMRSVPGAGKVTLAGSLRRRKAMVGDLDVLVSADDPRPFIEKLTRLPEVVEVLHRRADGGSVRLASLRQVDLRVVSFENWGAALHQLTGSKMHNIALRARFNRRQLKLTERGIWRRADEKLLNPCPSEEEIYAALGLPYVEPELRENQGELEAAEKGKLPRLVEAGDLRGDLHVAARGDPDTIRAMAHAARDLGYEYLAITDRADERELRRSMDLVHRLNTELAGPRLLAGAEVDVLADGTLAAPPDILAELDWVVAAVHDDLDMGPEEMTERLLRAMETGFVDALAHPTGRILGKRGPCAIDLERLIKTARRLGVALEANGDPRRMDLDEVACRQARRKGVPILVSSAATSPEQLRRRQFALAMARRGWLEPRHVLNAQPLRDALAGRASRRGQPVDVAGMEPEAAEDPSATLAARLTPSTLDDELVERLRRFLEKGDDKELLDALGRLSSNPVQQAFNLLMTR